MIVVMIYPKPLDPYGVVTQSSGLSHTDYGFTGESYSPSTQLTYLRARYYNPYLNHFTQPDSIVPDPSNSQDWNRYAYVRNNPVNYTDPSGHHYNYGETTPDRRDLTACPPTNPPPPQECEFQFL